MSLRRSTSRSSSTSTSSSNSFHTAPRSPMSISEEPALAAESLPLQKQRYRRGAAVSAELRAHCHIFLDEQLYTSALVLLTDLVTSGASHPDCLQKPTYVPVPVHIEYISALLIHPKHTNQALPSERIELASRAITFLRNVLAILGPLNANLGEAFSFSAPIVSRNLRRSRNSLVPEDASSESDEEGRWEKVKGTIANKGRIRRCAKDFWHMVGWAFNCSVKYPRRWRYWKVWLDYMLDVLDADWMEREQLDLTEVAHHDSEDSPEIEHEYKMLRQSLLVRYLSDTTGRSSAMKRVVRSVLAAGDLENLKSFPEVFENETKGNKHQNGQKRKREDPRKFGDYDDDEVEALFDSSELTAQSLEPSQVDFEDGLAAETWLGGTESIVLRQRLIGLLSHVAATLPEAFADCVDVYEELFESIRRVPLPAFSLLVSSSNSSALPLVVFISLSQLILSRILSSESPHPHSVSGQTDDALSQLVLEKCFLPYTADTSSVADNARVSILVESLFRLLSTKGACEYTPALEEAVETGILAREHRISGDKRRKDSLLKKKAEEQDSIWLRTSAKRLRSQLNWLKHNSQT